MNLRNSLYLFRTLLNVKEENNSFEDQHEIQNYIISLYFDLSLKSLVR